MANSGETQVSRSPDPSTVVADRFPSADTILFGLIIQCMAMRGLAVML